jgi:phosphoribosylaminoimidazolecarboxamide formyltransferase / IMP cyclohydrolase
MVGARQEGEDRPLTKLAIRRALISVYDKTGLAELARGLHAAGVEIVSTGTTAATIAGCGIPVTAVEDLTGFPECLDGRVKTLHPRVHAGLLADLGNPAHRTQIDDMGIAPFGLLVSNLYPFTAAVASGAGPGECVEQIDIGGPAMVRAAAKNHASVAVVTDPAAYPELLAAVRAGGFTLEARRRLAAAAFAHTAAYDTAVSAWFAGVYAPDETAHETGWPKVTGAQWLRREVLRYGENPHQRAALYESSDAPGLAQARQLQGKEMSYNNYVDADAAWRAAWDFTQPCVAIIKHTNPCGIAVGSDVAEAHRKAHVCDPLSAFGGIIAANRPVTEALASQIAEILTEVVVAPAFDDGALEVLAAKKNLRLLRCAPPGEGPAVEWRPITGGVLMQTADRADTPGDDPAAWELRAGSPAGPATLADLAFAWRACRAVKSNAIVLAAGGATVGIGMGQVNRVDSARLAAARAGDRARGAAAASDAYFPFPDGLEALADAGVRAVVEPGGSIRDGAVIASAEAAGVSLYFTGTRHFFH